MHNIICDNFAPWENPKGTISRPKSASSAVKVGTLWGVCSSAGLKSITESGDHCFRAMWTIKTWLQHPLISSCSFLDLEMRLMRIPQRMVYNGQAYNWWFIMVALFQETSVCLCIQHSEMLHFWFPAGFGTGSVHSSRSSNKHSYKYVIRSI